MQYTIKNERLTVTIESLGAQPVSVVCGGRERLWQNENGAWTGHAPVLFPVCGHFAVTVNGINYPMRAHGFAKRTEFSLLEKGGDFIELAIKDDENTRAVYPFAFVFAVRYLLKENTLAVSYRVTNTGNVPLAFSCGGHPSFALEGGVEDYCLEFDKEEHLVHLSHDKGGYLTGERVDFGTHKRFALPKEYLQDEDTIIFGDADFCEATLAHRSGKRIAKISFKGFPHLLLWRPLEANMICMEPWLNLPDLKGDDHTELFQKSGVLPLRAGETKTLSYRITYY